MRSDEVETTLELDMSTPDLNRSAPRLQSPDLGFTASTAARGCFRPIPSLFVTEDDMDYPSRRYSNIDEWQLALDRSENRRLLLLQKMQDAQDTIRVTAV